MIKKNRVVQYSIHGLVDFSIANPSPSLVSDMNDKYSYFKTATASHPVDIAVSIGKTAPPIHPPQHLIDHKYHISENKVDFFESSCGLSFHCSVEGLYKPKTKIGICYSKKNNLIFPYCFYPDFALNQFVLEPLLIRYLLLKNAFLIHAAAVSLNGKCVLLSGRGGSYKTSLCMNLIRDSGALFYGDDMVLIHNNKVLPFPVHAKIFAAMVSHLSSENEYGLLAKVKIAHDLFNKKPFPLSLAQPATPAALVTVCVKRGMPKAHVEEISSEDAVQSLVANTLLEWKFQCTSKLSLSAQFLNAYESVYAKTFPDADAQLQKAMNETLKSIPSFRLTVPQKWNHENHQLLSDTLAKKGIIGL